MLRERLTVACDHVTPERNIELVHSIAAEYAHTALPLQSEHDLRHFTCVMHAFGFTGQARYTAVAALAGHDVYAGREFAEWLVAGPLVAVDEADAEAGAIVMYFGDDEAFTHVGLLTAPGRVQSKWGTVGLYEHGVFEVPSNYGNKVRYFQHVPYEEAIELFYDFAEQKGVQFEKRVP